MHQDDATRATSEIDRMIACSEDGWGADKGVASWPSDGPKADSTVVAHTAPSKCRRERDGVSRASAPDYSCRRWIITCRTIECSVSAISASELLHHCGCRCVDLSARTDNAAGWGRSVAVVEQPRRCSHQYDGITARQPLQSTSATKSASFCHGRRAASRQLSGAEQTLRQRRGRAEIRTHSANRAR
jgi:hypothetical protein